jgi:hypothetical protein
MVLHCLQELNVQSEVGHLSLQLLKALTELTSLAGLHMHSLRENTAGLSLNSLQDLLQLLHQVFIIFELSRNAFVVKL